MDLRYNRVNGLRIEGESFDLSEIGIYPQNTSASPETIKDVLTDDIRKGFSRGTGRTELDLEIDSRAARGYYRYNGRNVALVVIPR